MSDFNEAVKSLLVIEGGFVDDPADPGGRTNFGVTQTSWNGYRSQVTGGANLPVDVQDMSREQAIVYYQSQWWDPYHIGQIVHPLLASAFFHLAVNEGIHPATSVLQRAINFVRKTADGTAAVVVAEDGKLGPATIQAANQRDAAAMLFAFLFSAAISYGLIAAARPASLRFLKGWFNRLKADLWVDPGLTAE